MSRGRNKYVPKNVMDRLLTIKRSEGLNRDVEAWDKFVRYFDIGCNADEFYGGIFGVPKRRKKL